MDVEPAAVEDISVDVVNGLVNGAIEADVVFEMLPVADEPVVPAATEKTSFVPNAPPSPPIVSVAVNDVVSAFAVVVVVSGAACVP